MLIYSLNAAFLVACGNGKLGPYLLAVSESMPEGGHYQTTFAPFPLLLCFSITSAQTAAANFYSLLRARSAAVGLYLRFARRI